VAQVFTLSITLDSGATAEVEYEREAPEPLRLVISYDAHKFVIGISPDDLNALAALSRSALAELKEQHGL
jgi:hypothetical protein